MKAIKKTYGKVNIEKAFYKLNQAACELTNGATLLKNDIKSRDLDYILDFILQLYQGIDKINDVLNYLE